MKRLIFLVILASLLPSIFASAQQLPISPLSKFLEEGMVGRVQLVGNRLYAACGSWLVVLDGSDSLTTGLRLGRLDFGDMISDFRIPDQDTVAFVLTTRGGLRIVDLRNDANMQVIGTVDSVSPNGRTVGALAIAGNWVYATLINEVRIFDVSNRTAPLYVGCFALPAGSPMSVAATGDHLYVGDTSGRIHTYSLSNPASPQWLSQTASAASEQYPYEMMLRDTLLYTAFNHGGIRIFNLSNPDSPVLASIINAPPSRNPLGIAVNDSLLCVATGTNNVSGYPGGLYLYRLITPTSLLLLGHFERNGDDAVRCALGPHRAYLGGWSNSAIALDITAPQTPLPVRWTYAEAGNYPSGIAARDTLVLVANYKKGLSIFGAGVPMNPRLLSDSALGGWAADVAVDGNIAYVAIDGHAAVAVDLSIPSSPSILASFNTVTSAWDVKVAGQLVYWLEGSQLSVWDVSNQQSPVRRSFVSLTGARAVELDGDRAYVAANGALKMIDISNPNQMQISGSVSVPGEGMGVAVFGQTAYIATDTGGLSVVNVADRAAPVVVGRIDTTLSGLGTMCRAGHYLYVAAGSGGVRVYDLTDPVYPVLRGVCRTIGGSHDVCIAGDMAYVADLSAGCAVLDASSFTVSRSPSCLVLPARCQTCGNGTDFTLRFNPAAGYAYHTLSTMRTYCSRRVHFADALPWQDLNGDNDDDFVVDAADTSLARLRAVILDSLTAEPDADYPNVLYLAGSGEYNAIRLNDAGERLRADTLAAWLNAANLEQYHRSVVILDADRAGSFVGSLAHPGRVVIASTGAYQALALPGMPFDQVFWRRIALGENLWAAFDSARVWVSQRSNGAQTPLLDADGNGQPNQPSDSVIACQILLGRGVSLEYTEHEGATLPGIVDAPDTTVADAGLDIQFTQAVDMAWYHVLPANYTGQPPLDSLPYGLLQSTGGNRYHSPAPDMSRLDSTIAWMVQIDAASRQQLAYPHFSRLLEHPVPHQDAPVPFEYFLHQNYPNPFNPETRIEFGISAASQVTLSVWNILGQKVTTLVQARLEAGYHSVIWDGRTAAGVSAVSGLYFLSLDVNNLHAVRKMVLLR